jgi:aminoglycoside phosphotransferase (APT) family kinase protein
MALLTHRDPLVVGAGLASWLAARTGASDVGVVDAGHPSVGYSSETVLVDLSWNENGNEQARGFVVRLAPPTLGTFRDYDLGIQMAAQLAAGAAGVAIASPELVTDPRWLGAPFIVMPRVQGHIVGEVAALDPWLGSLSATARARVHESFVTAIATTHRADTRAATGVPVRDNEAELDYWAEYLDWSSGGAPVPALVEALQWCHAHRPDVASEPVLLWGDVRLGNVIFGDDLAPRAVLDWDMTSVGAREHDVTWFTALESTMHALVGRHLDGFPDRDGTIAQYESASGHALRNVAWYETFAMLRSTAIMTRIGYLRRDAGVEHPMPIDDNPLLDLLRARIASGAVD